VTEPLRKAWVRDWAGEAEPVTRESWRRIRLLRKIGHERELRQGALAACAADIAVFINDWGWTFDPRNKAPLPKRLPMILWPRQVEFVHWVLGRVDGSQKGLAKKSRDVGVSWLMVFVATWLWLFRPDTVIKFGSRKEAMVDRKGDPECIFWKIRFVLDNLPRWMLPDGFVVGGEFDNFMRIVNPQNGSTITGEGGDNMGRGGRATVYLIDEYASVPRAESVWASVVDNADTVIVYSTSAGPGTMFFRLEHSGTMPVFRFHYSDDPRKDEGWRDQTLGYLGAANFAKEHEMDDFAALEQQIIPGPWVQAAVELALPSSTASVSAGCDPADTGGDDTVFCARQGPHVQPLQVWSKALDHHAYRWVHELTEGSGAAILHYDRVGVGAGLAGGLKLLGAGYEIVGIANGGRVPEHWVFDDDPTASAKERFADIATALWWNLRLRFERTYEYVNGEGDHEVEDLITIPNDSTLITQLTSRKYLTSGDKVRLESKDAMSRRGIKSPDHAEALAYAYCPQLAKRSTEGGVVEGKSRAKRLFKRGW